MSAVWIQTWVAFGVCMWEINANSRSWMGKSSLSIWKGLNDHEHVICAPQILDPQTQPAFLVPKAYCCLRTKSTCSQKLPCQLHLNKLSKDSLQCVRRIAVYDWQHSHPHFHLHQLRQVSLLFLKTFKGIQAVSFCLLIRCLVRIPEISLA